MRGRYARGRGKCGRKGEELEGDDKAMREQKRRAGEG